MSITGYRRVKEGTDQTVAMVRFGKARIKGFGSNVLGNLGDSSRRDREILSCGPNPYHKVLPLTCNLYLRQASCLSCFIDLVKE